MLTIKQRFRAVFNCLYFGILPYWLYEKRCHYKGGKDVGETYFEHLKMNLLTAKFLILRKEHPCTHKFHKQKCKYFRWQWK